MWDILIYYKYWQLHNFFLMLYSLNKTYLPTGFKSVLKGWTDWHEDWPISKWLFYSKIQRSMILIRLISMHFCYLTSSSCYDLLEFGDGRDTHHDGVYRLVQYVLYPLVSCLQINKLPSTRDWWPCSKWTDSFQRIRVTYCITEVIVHLLCHYF